MEGCQRNFPFGPLMILNGIALMINLVALEYQEDLLNGN